MKSPEPRPLYEIVYRTDRSLLPREMESMRERLVGAVRITE
ncbi:MAG TPA: hypothetical protein VH109_07580 [Steroidobacteraceae bacterium]|nr:hypothetical protein [Steroidobacteraceae bacterium]